MVKSKQRQLMAKSSKSKSTSSRTFTDSLNNKTVNPNGEDSEESWVIVKKQKITILIPPLTVKKTPTMPKPEEARVQATPVKVVKERPQRTVYRFGFIDRNALTKRTMRASNLERKLQRAGGLSQWLTSVGLERFARLFEAKSVGKFQLVNMSMNKLKEMGAAPVGPRRKLMHAIDCLCQPYTL